MEKRQTQYKWSVEGKSSATHVALRKQVCSLWGSWAGGGRQQGCSPRASPVPWKRHRSTASLRRSGPLALLQIGRQWHPRNLCGAAGGGRLKCMSVLLLRNRLVRQIEGEEKNQVNALSLLSKMEWQLQRNPLCLDV